MGNLNKEIDAIRAKEGSQGGLTQGQQTQIARNEQRIEAVSDLPGGVLLFSSAVVLYSCIGDCLMLYQFLPDFQRLLEGRHLWMLCGVWFCKYMI